MKDETKKVLRAKLEEEKKALETELSQIGVVDTQTGDWEATPEAGEPSSDDNDLADKFEDFEERTATMNTLEPRLALINQALAHMDNNDGSYGICRVCGNAIEEERLMANPSSDTCREHMQ